MWDAGCGAEVVSLAPYLDLGMGGVKEEDERGGGRAEWQSKRD